MKNGHNNGQIAEDRAMGPETAMEPLAVAGRPATVTVQEFAIYSCSLLKSLRDIADKSNLPLFSHLLELARVEASRIADDDGTMPSN